MTIQFLFNVFEKIEEFKIPHSLIHSQRGLEVGFNFASAMRLHMIASGPFGQSRVIPLSFVVLIELGALLTHYIYLWINIPIPNIL